MSFPETRGTVFRNLKEANLTELCKTVLEAPSKVADGNQKERGVRPVGGQEQVLGFLENNENSQAFSRKGRGYGSSPTVRWLRYG